MPKHDTDIIIEKKMLARMLADLRYDALEEFLHHLKHELYVDAMADQRRGRVSLGKTLINAGDRLADAADAIGIAWKISKRHMEPDGG